MYNMWFYFKCLDVDKKQDDIILPPPLIPLKVVDDFEDVDKELEEELENMDLDDDVQSMVHILPNLNNVLHRDFILFLHLKYVEIY